MAGRLITREGVVKRLEALCSTFPSRAAFARRIRVTPQYVYAVLLGFTPPGARILEALNLRRVDRYEEAVPSRRRREADNGAAASSRDDRKRAAPRQGAKRP